MSQRCGGDTREPEAAWGSVLQSHSSAEDCLTEQLANLLLQTGHLFLVAYGEGETKHVVSCTLARSRSDPKLLFSPHRHAATSL